MPAQSAPPSWRPRSQRRSKRAAGLGPQSELEEANRFRLASFFATCGRSHNQLAGVGATAEMHLRNNPCSLLSSPPNSVAPSTRWRYASPWPLRTHGDRLMRLATPLLISVLLLFSVTGCPDKAAKDQAVGPKSADKPPDRKDDTPGKDAKDGDTSPKKED